MPAGKVTREVVWRSHERVNAGNALQMEPGDRNVLVAVIDTGLDDELLRALEAVARQIAGRHAQ